MIPTNIENKNQIIPKYEIYAQAFVSDKDDVAISFTESISEYCVGIVDIISSTKITATISPSRIGTYYTTFLNTMNLIVKRYGGVVVKNGGDSLLYYFPESTNDAKPEFLRCLECNLAMVEVHRDINTRLYKEKLPSLHYRVSADYGKAVLAKSSNSTHHDIFGTPVNMCSKINSRAAPNTAVIGGDLYQEVKDLPGYSFHEVKGCSVGFKFQYPIYTVVRNDHQSKSIIDIAIEQSLLEISTTALDTITNCLFNEYKCFLSDCYKNPEYLSKILKGLFGNSYTAIVETIRKNLGEYIQQKPIREFLEQLSK